MHYPDFFNHVPTIKLQDPLSAFLGTLEEGLVEFSYLDIVKSAGHSCPTVAGAYLTTLKGLEALYKEELPIRGNIMVSFKDDAKEGVTGVVASVIGQITGATESTGFKGMNGNFIRHGLMDFNADTTASVTFGRVDTKQSVAISYDPSSIPPHPKQQELMGKIMKGIASNDEKKEFARLWQERVKNIVNNIDNVITIKDL